MLSKLEEHDVNENNKVGFKSLDINQKPHSKRSTLSPSQLLKQRAIESWYPSYHCLIILPENLVYLIVYSIFYYQLFKKNFIKLSEAITLILIVFFLHFLYDLDILSNKMYNFIFYPINIYIISKNFFLTNKIK